MLMFSLWFHNWPLLGMGFALVAIGVVNGLYFLELRVEKLEEEKRDAKVKTPQSN